jgi:uncharacterized repeat protein (TIGR03803 family)
MKLRFANRKTSAVLVWSALTQISMWAQNLTTLYSFSLSGGLLPRAGLVQGLDGNLWGMTPQGGSQYGGTIFKITTSGTLTTMYNFCAESGCTDGYSPLGALVQTGNGDFYGTAGLGGINCSPGGCGTIFKITPDGNFTTLY